MGWMQALGAQLLHRLFMFFISPLPFHPGFLHCTDNVRMELILLKSPECTGPSKSAQSSPKSIIDHTLASRFDLERPTHVGPFSLHFVGAFGAKETLTLAESDLRVHRLASAGYRP